MTTIHKSPCRHYGHKASPAPADIVDHQSSSQVVTRCASVRRWRVERSTWNNPLHVPQHWTRTRGRGDNDEETQFLILCRRQVVCHPPVSMTEAVSSGTYCLHTCHGHPKVNCKAINCKVFQSGPFTWDGNG